MYVADYVLMEYGTGAIMAVPAHDQRDFEFADEVRPADPPGRRAARRSWRRRCPARGDGALINSGRFDGLHNREAIDADHRLARGARAAAKRAVNYRLRDWLLSRQRYWGCPIPIVYCETRRHRARCRRGPAAGRAARRRGLRAEGQVAAAPRPRTGSTRPARSAAGPARRETDTMDTFVDSSWYFLRYCDAAQRPGAVGARGGRPLDAGRPVHRRRRARDPAPDVRALLHEGAGGHRPGWASRSRSRGSSPRG